LNLSISASGMIAGFQRQAASANNVANMRTPNYQSQRVELSAGPGGGVRVSGVTRDTRPGPLVFDDILASLPDPGGNARLRGYIEQSNVDLSREFVDQILTKAMVTANARAFSAQSDSYRTVLNLLG
jgi:flagellar basal body rod protein FlgG